MYIYTKPTQFSKMKTAASGINGKYVSFSPENLTTFRIFKIM